MKKRWVFLMMTSFLLAACSNQKTADTADQAKNKQEITVAVDQEMSSMDSTLATDTYSITALNNTMEGLYRLTSENELLPAGAAALPEVNKEGLEYTIELNKEAVWSDGSPVTAQDYIYSWQKAVDPKTKAEYGYLFEPIKNAKDILAGKKDKSELGIKAVNSHKLQIELATTAPYFESLLAFPTFFPQREEFVEEEGDQYATSSDNLLYNGPFELKKFDGAGTDTTWTYQKNDNYWDKDKVKLEKIDNQVVKESSTGVNMFETGDVDDVLLTGELAKQYASNKAFTVIEKAGTTYLSYNYKKEAFQNEKVRQAISLSLDRASLVDQILGDGSIEPTGLVPSKMSFSPESKEDFAKEAGTSLKTDKKAAQELWTQAKEELDIEKLDIELVTYDTDSIKKLAEYIQSALEDNLDGVKIDISIVPVTVAIERGQKTDFDLFLFGWTADYPDPSSFLDLFITDSPYNYGKYSNQDYDQLIENAKGKDANDLTKRWNDYLQAERLLMKETAVTPVFQKAEARLRNPKLKGVVSHSTGAQFDYKEAYLK